MKYIVTNKNYKKLITSASLFTTGGGISVSDQLQYLRTKKIYSKILPLSNFPKNASLCVVAELGPTASKPINKTKYIRKMIQLLEKTTGKNIHGIYAPELGQECVLLEASSLSKLPIADFSPTGMRAVPCVDIHIFNILNKKFSYSPMVILTDAGELLLIPDNIEDNRLEEILRQLTVLSQNKTIFVVGGVVDVKELSVNEINESPYSILYSINKTNSLQNLLEKFDHKIVLKGRVKDIKTIEIKGFFAEKITLETQNEQVTIVVMNEAIFLLNSDNQIVASVPERILLVDPSFVRGLSSAELKKGREIFVIVLKAEKAFSKKRAYKIFGKERFKFLLS